jgi:hypothetical protein
MFAIVVTTTFSSHTATQNVNSEFCAIDIEFDAVVNSESL